MMALLASANSDPTHFVDLEHLDLRRPCVRHAEYGGGMHLARLEAGVALEGILARWRPISLAKPADERRCYHGPFRLPLIVTGVRRRPTGAVGNRDLAMAGAKV
ncbi:MAG: hypothetical protein ABMA14_10315 [Hyphomonadaceae bacterium]